MAEEKKRIKLPIIVEGKYDKNTILQIFSATVIPVGGFGIFNSKEKQALLRKIGKGGIIVLTDSDGGGRQIRSFLSGILPPEAVHHVYAPRLHGKEKRKDKPSREGVLGVEGMSREVLLRLLSPFVIDGGRDAFSARNDAEMITKLDFFEDGLSGSDMAAERRARLALHFDLPQDMTAKALIEALNLITDRESYKNAVYELFGE